MRPNVAYDLPFRKFRALNSSMTQATLPDISGAPQVHQTNVRTMPYSRSRPLPSITLLAIRSCPTLFSQIRIIYLPFPFQVIGLQRLQLIKQHENLYWVKANCSSCVSSEGTSKYEWKLFDCIRGSLNCQTFCQENRNLA